VAVVLDTNLIADPQRGEALITAMHEASVPSYVIPENTEAPVTARLDVWTFGQASIFRAAMSGIQLVRTPRHARIAPSPDLALAVQESADGQLDQGGTQRLVRPGELMIADLNSAYDFGWRRDGASRCLYVPLDQLGLPHHVIQDASTHLERSPLYPLLVEHINTLTEHADRLCTDPAAPELGAASVELVRALLASAARHQAYAAGALAETLMTQIRGYIRRNLSDSTLSPDTIAAAHNISTRYLYKVCGQADFSLEQWIISQRLQGARDELARPASRHRSVAAIAARWGFANPTFFSRRFRTTYGITPREWRRIVAENDWRPNT
jgi:AraC-like DNA-binding protein